MTTHLNVKFKCEDSSLVPADPVNASSLVPADPVNATTLVPADPVNATSLVPADPVNADPHDLARLVQGKQRKILK